MKLEKKFLLSVAILLLALFVAVPSSFKPMFKEGQALGFLSFLNPEKINLGLDLQGGTQLEYKIDLSKFPADQQKRVVDGVEAVIQKRVNGIGVAEPTIYNSDVAGEKHIYVELAGIKDIEQAKETVGKTIQLEFKEQKQNLADDEQAKVKEAANALLGAVKDNAALFEAEAGKVKEEGKVDYKKEEMFKDQLPEAVRDKVWALGKDTVLNEVVEGAEGYMLNGDNVVPYTGLYVVKAGEKKKELRKDPKNAEDFMKVAEEASDVKPVDLGYVGKTEINAVREAGLALNTGEVSDVVDAGDFYAIVKSLDKLPKEEEMVKVQALFFATKNTGALEGAQKEREEGQKKIVEQQATANKARADILPTPEKFADIAKEYAAKSNDQIVYENPGAVVEGTTDPEMEKVVFGLPVKGVSEVFTTKEGLNIVLLNDKTVNAEQKNVVQYSRLLFKTPTLPEVGSIEEAKSFNENAKKKAETLIAETSANPAVFAEKAEAIAKESKENYTYTDAGYIKREGVAFAEGAFATEEGKISTLVETPSGYYVLYVQDKKAKDEELAKLAVLSVCYKESAGCAKERSKEEAKKRADELLVRVRQEEKMVYEQVFFSTVPEQWTIAMVDGKALTGEFFKYADVVYQQGGFQPVVQVQFNDEGAKLFERITERNVGKQLAIFVGGEMVSQATVQQKIPGGTAVITGNFTPEVATKMARDLNTGALPTAIELVGQETIGSILGQEALVQSVKAGAIGVLILLLFMLFYYRYQGLVANIALGFYVVIMVALVKFFGVTLTLAGIAALILSVGMAVDANVLIFSRLKEELAHGRDMTSTINTAFKRAWSSIFDSNVSSLITALILFWFGTGMIKGFAVVFSLGILVSVFSAVYVTRVILLLSARTAWGKKLIKW